MKNIIKTLIAVFAVFAVSCSDDVENRPTVYPTNAPVLSAPDQNANYVLTVENAESQAERFVWTPANFFQAVEVTYTVQIAQAGNEFANTRDLGSVSNLNNLSVSVESLNEQVLALGGESQVQGQYEVRIKASLNDTAAPMYSNAVVIFVTPYVAEDPELFLVGAVQPYYGLNIWDNATAMPMRYIGTDGAKVFEAFVKVASGDGFKFIGEQGTWDNGNYGVIGGAQNGNLEDSSGSGDIKVAESDGPGLYYIQVDIDQMKYKYVKMNWGIIGSATAGSWDNETAMSYDFTSNQFSISTSLSAGEMKFRSGNTGTAMYSDPWKFNVGVSDPTVVFNPGAGNFPVAGGAYNLGLVVNFDGTAAVSGF